MNYLLAYTTVRARRIIENYQSLPNGCQIALQVRKQRFGQNAMIVEALKAPVLRGPKLRKGDSEALLTLSDKIFRPRGVNQQGCFVTRRVVESQP